MKGLSIMALCVLAAIVYGVVHDQVTARICVEYFTIGHPPLFVTDSPTLLGLGWGVLGTWWVGLILGAVLACAARLGQRPKLGARALVPSVLRLLGIMAAFAVVAGIVGFALASLGWVALIEPMASAVPKEQHVRFIAVLWAHSAGYGVALFGGLAVVVRTWRSRACLGSAGS